jgi:hypothetical protein
MARMEELRRRATEPPASPGTVVEELVQAARRAVDRDRELAITVTVEYRGRTSAVRVEQQGGEITVTVVPEQREPRGPAEASPAVPPTPPEPVAPSAPAEPSAASQLAELLRRSQPT